MSKLIDADALKKDVARLHVLNDEAEIRRAYEYNPHVTSTDFEETLVSVFDAIDDAPTIEPKRGEWKPFDLTWGRSIWYCTACEESTEVPTYLGTPMYNFCPMCGADMNMKKADGCKTENSSEIPNNCEDEQTETQTKTQNSNLTFEKRTMRDCYNCKRYETEGECIECHYEPKTSHRRKGASDDQRG